MERIFLLETTILKYTREGVKSVLLILNGKINNTLEQILEFKENYEADTVGSRTIGTK